MSKRGGNNSGRWTIVAIFVFAAAVWVGLFLAPQSRPPALPEGLRPGPPREPLIGILFDAGPLRATPDRIVPSLKALPYQPDLLLLTDIDSDVVPAVAAAFEMRQTFHPQLLQRVRPSADSKSEYGVAILSRRPLYGGSSVRSGDRRVGVLAYLDVGGAYLGVRNLFVVSEEEADRLRAVPADETRPWLIGTKAVGGLSMMISYGAMAGSSEAPELMMIEEVKDPPALIFKISRREGGAGTGPTTSE